MGLNVGVHHCASVERSATIIPLPQWRKPVNSHEEAQWLVRAGEYFTATADFSAGFIQSNQENARSARGAKVALAR
jgi:hypothetical protein